MELLELVRVLVKNLARFDGRRHLLKLLFDRDSPWAREPLQPLSFRDRNLVSHHISLLLGSLLLVDGYSAPQKRLLSLFAFLLDACLLEELVQIGSIGDLERLAGQLLLIIFLEVDLIASRLIKKELTIG